MARRKSVKETLSQETPEVQEELLKDLMTETSTTESDPVEIDMSNEPAPEMVQNMGLQIDEVFVEEATQPEEAKVEEVKVEEVKVEEPKKEGLRPKDRVKIKPEIGHDMVGRRIHNGIKNYLYTVKNVRDDGYVTIECLTYIFTLHSRDLILVKRG